MIDVLAHRGVFGGVWSDGGVALAQSYRERPAASLGNDTVVHRDGDLVIVADARIDNRDDLVRTLRPVGGGATDAELIGAAYRRWGSNCAEHLVGDFAFAIWDGRTHALFCARDCFGVRPLYYFRGAGIFAFASEVKALLTEHRVSRELDEEQIALFLAWTPGEPERTMYRHILRLPAAHALRVDGHGMTLWRYWRLDPERELRLASSDEYVEAFREHFAEAVRCRLRGARPVGASLSGGLDSSSIVCMAHHLGGREATGEPLHAYSVVFPDAAPEDRPLIDERPFIDAVRRGNRLESHELRGDELSPLMDVRRVVWHLDEPYLAPNLYLHWGMFGAAASHGVGTFLDGFDGDTSVSHGLGRLNTLARTGEWGEFEREAKGFAAHRTMNAGAILPSYGFPLLDDLARRHQWAAWRRGASELAGRFALSRRETFVQHGLRPLVPDALVQRWSAFRRVSVPDDTAILRRELARRVRSRARALTDDPLRSERDAHIAGLTEPFHQLTLEMSDKCAAAFGIEPRYPFFDRRLVEFCVALPETEKFANGWSRYTFRRAMQGILPPEIQWRGTKGNLSSNFFRRLVAADLAHVDQQSTQCLEPFVDLQALRALRARVSSRSGRGLAHQDGFTLFRAATLAAWLTSHQPNRQASARRPNDVVSVVA
jgi:asparagine synthase (glutamine-hydrolysing)